MRIREKLSSAISDLATTLGVTRQSIYHSLNGETDAEENVAKLRDLAHAADMLAHEKIPVNSTRLKRKFANGKTLFQLAQAGESARTAAMLLTCSLLRNSMDSILQVGWRPLEHLRTTGSVLPLANPTRAVNEIRTRRIVYFIPN